MSIGGNTKMVWPSAFFIFFPSAYQVGNGRLSVRSTERRVLFIVGSCALRRLRVSVCELPNGMG